MVKNMRVLVTGAGGFAGGNLVRLLHSLGGFTLHGTMMPGEIARPHIEEAGVLPHVIDLRDPDAVYRLLGDIAPDAIYHLAAQAYVPISWEKPWDTLENNIRAQVNIQHALIQHGAKPRMLVIGSAEEYGSVRSDDMPIHEDFPLRPESPYSVSKVTQDMLGLQVYLSHALPIIRVRPFNHIGPGQRRDFVASSFAAQITEAEAGQREAVIEVGNLDAKRDFTDVRDVVNAYYLVLTHGTPGQVYNIGTGVARSIQSLLDILLDLSYCQVEIRRDPARMRPSDRPLVVCDTTKLRLETGWEPKISFEQSLLDVINDWRQRIRDQ